MMPPCQRYPAWPGGPIRTTAWNDIVVWDGQGTTTAGTTRHNTNAWFMTVSGGKVIDGTAFYDSIAFNELWNSGPRQASGCRLGRNAKLADGAGHCFTRGFPAVAGLVVPLPALAVCRVRP